jgi:L-ribulose-5-phosphate 3-epimerase
LNPIGIMQGRLLPPVGGKIQAFPVDGWRQEFALAADAGLCCIEWVYEANAAAANPLASDEGVEEINRLVDDSGVSVRSVCADYFMKELLVAPDGTARDASAEHLVSLMGRAAAIGVRHIVLPFVDESSMRSAGEVDGVVEILRSVLPAAERAGVELHLETDLGADQLASLVDRSDGGGRVRVTYDIGNEASLGYEPEEALSILGPRVGSVHVKDRPLGGGTVPLGTGAADFDTCFRMLAGAGYSGRFILQAARRQACDEVETARADREFVLRRWSAALEHREGRVAVSDA